MEEHDKTSKLIMWSKINELISKGLKKSQISQLLGVHRQTVSRYASMSYEEFTSSTSFERLYSHKLDAYEDFVVDYLTEFPFVSAAQVHDHLRENKPDFPKVSDKTVFNFVRRLRLTHDIPKEEEDDGRQMCRLPETAFGEYGQVDFGEKWMFTPDGRRIKVYFMVMVLSRSRYKFVYFSRTPFTSALAVYAHELAFQYFGGKPKKLVYDQDRVFIHDENLGDYLLTARFKAFVSSEGLEVVFCRRSDPQSKGKVENAVKYVKNNFLSARRFRDIDTLNAEGLAWLGRTANGTEHHGIRRIPAEVFAEEKEWLMPWSGTPALPEVSMELRTVRQDNTVMYAGCWYTVPAGTYRNRDSKVYVEERSGTVNLYDVETGKSVATHPLGSVKGQTVRNANHMRRPSEDRTRYRDSVLAMLPDCGEARTWMARLEEDRPRYLRDNLSILERGLYRYDSDTMCTALAKCLEKSVYNAKVLMEVAEAERRRCGKALLQKPVELPQSMAIPDQTPARSDISKYESILIEAV